MRLFRRLRLRRLPYLLLGAALVFLMTATALAAPRRPGPSNPAASGSAARVQVGQEAPDFRLQSTGGATYSLHDRKNEKQLVLIFFRGTW